jgi:hypothetical protein
MAQIAINSRDATSTGVSPFFLQHSYNFNPLQLQTPEELAQAQGAPNNCSDNKKAEQIVSKLQSVFELAQASMASAQQEQERQANRSRQEA